jgi:acetyltransferase-like isoleucine patch superfamily enzyme
MSVLRFRAKAYGSKHTAKKMISSNAFVHSHAIVEPGATVGAGTRVWAWAHVLPGAFIGDDCNICDHCFIENDVTIGDRVTIKCGIYLWDGARIGNDVHLGPNVVFTNDLYPRSKQAFEVGVTIVQDGASVGANSTLLPGITVGKYALVGAGSVVTRNVPAFALVRGNPARRVGWVCACGQKLKLSAMHPHCTCRCGKQFEWVSEALIVESS